ncbi:hypothetical protein GCM10009000_074890 [Halobacterium noricense]|uniref:CAAX protease self-immunity n=1 Tax=Haladaptatus pallidirubidus TaxID=1008152 RepID=A0AAV3UM77_9EURY
MGRLPRRGVFRRTLWRASFRFRRMPFFGFWWASFTCFWWPSPHIRFLVFYLSLSMFVSGFLVARFVIGRMGIVVCLHGL